MNVKCSQGHASFCSAASLVFGLAFIQGAVLLAPDSASPSSIGRGRQKLAPPSTQGVPTLARTKGLFQRLPRRQERLCSFSAVV